MDEQNIRLLVVEDDPGDVRLLQEMLHDVPGVAYEIWHAETLQEGVTCLGESRFHVVLLDLTLPDSNNLATFLKFKEAAAGLPVIVLTGVNDGDLARAAVRKGAQDFLVKGYVDRRLLDSSIRYAIERQRLALRMQKVNETVLEAERNRVVQETAGGAAHLINQPLTVITVVADHLLHDMNPVDPNYDLVVSLKSAADRIDDIVKDMQHAKRYATRPYVDSSQIVDFPSAARNAKDDGPLS
jgi:DNA-binding NtrC family response regulator